jgi:hypothetical protein
MNRIGSIAKGFMAAVVLSSPLMTTLAPSAVMAATKSASVVRYQAIPSFAATPEGFVPAGWNIEKRAQGDMNGDDVTDMALVLRKDDPAKRFQNIQKPAAGVIDTNPRMLVVILARQDGSGFTLLGENHTLFPAVTRTTKKDPFARVSVESNHVLQVEFQTSSNEDQATTIDFSFFLRPEGFSLVGYSRMDSEFNFLDTDETILRIFYLSGERQMVKRTTGGQPKPETTYLPKRPLSPFGSIGNALTFNPDARS